MKKRTTLVNRNVMLELMPRQYLLFLTKLNKEIDRVDTEKTVLRTFQVAALGETMKEDYSLGDVDDCNNGTIFLVCKN